MVAEKMVSLSMLSNCRSPFSISIVNSPGQRFVAAMFAPGLGDRFQLNIRRISLQHPKMITNGLHLGDGKAQLPLLADLAQLLVGLVVERNVGSLELIGMPR